MLRKTTELHGTEDELLKGLHADSLGLKTIAKTPD